MQALERLFPPWIARYRRAQLAADFGAGIVVAVLVIPQSLAYALLAGMPPQAGLYVSVLPVIAYALVGSSMTQAVGPVAITAIMSYTVLAPLAAPGSAEYVALAASLALLSGILVVVCGVLRLGFLSQLMSRPVVSGFISGSALLIVISQFGSLLGVKVGGVSMQLILSLPGLLAQANPATLALGGTSLAVLAASRYALPRVLRRFGLPDAFADLVVRLMPLLVVIAATLLVVQFDLDRQRGVAVVGAVSDGLVPFNLFVPALSTLKTLAVPALILALIGIVQNITMAQVLAIRRHERVDPNRELLGLGLANVVAAFSGGMPVGGGLSRSAVNVAAGAQSPLASIVSALAVLLILAGGTHWFARLPLAVLAASIILAALGMIDVKAVRLAWSYDRADALALLGCASGVVLVGIEAGIAIGIGLSLATLLLRASAPHIAVVGQIADSEHFRNVARHGVQTICGVLMLRIDESLFFGNLAAVQARLAIELKKAAGTHDLVLIMSGVNRVDTTAMEVLCEINRDLRERGIRLHLAEVKGPVQDRLAASPFWAALTGTVYLSAHSAFAALADAAAGAGGAASGGATPLPASDATKRAASSD